MKSKCEFYHHVDQWPCAASIPEASQPTAPRATTFDIAKTLLNHTFEQMLVTAAMKFCPLYFEPLQKNKDKVLKVFSVLHSIQCWALNKTP